MPNSAGATVLVRTGGASDRLPTATYALLITMVLLLVPVSDAIVDNVGHRQGGLVVVDFGRVGYDQ